MGERKFIRRSTPERRAFARFFGDIVHGLNRAAIASGYHPDQTAERQQRNLIRRALRGEGNLSLEDISNVAFALGYRIEVEFVKLPAVKEQAPDG